MAASAGLPANHPVAASLIRTGAGDTPWPLRAATQTGASVETKLDGLPPLPGGPWDDAASRALVVPLAAPGQEQPAGQVIGHLLAGPRHDFPHVDAPLSEDAIGVGALGGR